MNRATDGTRAPLPIVILISGRGSNMHAIVARAARGELPIDVRAVISNRADAAGLALAREFGVATEVIASAGCADRDRYDAALSAAIARYTPSLVVLAGFMRILTPSFIAAWRDRIVNIHPSLLPKHRGLHTHRRALEAGDHEHGASVHSVTEELDGGPLIIQACVDIQPDDTEATLSARVQRQEHIIYSQAIDWFARGRLELRDGRASLDGHVLEVPVRIDARGS
jgi:phosphoribosylglycinamide formyltransferase-1